MAQCKDDSCDIPHCSKCGSHYDPHAAGGSRVCDGCQIEAAMAEAEAATKAFGGNYEEAARVLGW